MPDSFTGDEGPAPVRDRAEHRWGLPNLPGHLRNQVMGDSVLRLRFLLFYAVAQASADGVLQTGVEEARVDRGY